MAEAPILGGDQEARRSTTPCSARRSTARSCTRPCVAELAARRRGTHATKTRGKVRGGGAKPWRQKGTGRARAGLDPRRRAGPAAASSSARSRATTPSRSTARRAAPRCAARCRSTPSAARSSGSTPARSTRRRPSRPPALLADSARRLRCSSCSADARSSRRSSPSATSPRVDVLPADDGRRRRRHRRRDARALSRTRSTQLDRARRRRAPDEPRRSSCLMDASQVIIRPVVSEKSYVLAATDKYTFRVHAGRAQDADPPGRRGALRRQGASTCARCRVKSKPKRRGYTSGRTRAWKKAIVQVRPGDSIPIFQGLEAGAELTCRSASPSPPSPGRRFATYPDFAEITQDRAGEVARRGPQEVRRPQRPRAQDRRHRGGGAKRLYRKIDFKRRKDGVPAKVAAIEYDPNRSAYIALLHYVDGEKRYILAPSRLRVGMTVQSGAGADITVGNCAAAGATSRPAPSSTTSSCSPAAAASSAAPPAPASS